MIIGNSEKKCENCVKADVCRYKDEFARDHNFAKEISYFSEVTQIIIECSRFAGAAE